MWKLCVFILFYSKASLCDTRDKLISNSTTVRNVGTYEPIQLRVPFEFSHQLPVQIERRTKSDLKLKCDAVFNVTKAVKNGVDLKEVPTHFLDSVLKNVQVTWLRNNKPLRENNRIIIKKLINKAHYTTTLRIRNLSKKDEGNYTCVIVSGKSEKRSQSKLFVKDYEVQTIDHKGFSGQGFTNSPTHVQILSSDSTQNVVSTTQKTLPEPEIEPLCQLYSGSICSQFLKGHFVYVAHNTTVESLEYKLSVAFKVVNFSRDIRSHCEGFAWPSLCYSTFPICRSPIETNENYLQYAKAVITAKAILQQHEGHLSNTSYKLDIQNDPIEKILNYRYNNSIVRRVCRLDCEIIENELCQKEYAIAKKHHLIGQQLYLEECFDLPEDDPDCLKVGVLAMKVSDEDCYWEKGEQYYGKVNISIDEEPCMLWHEQMYTTISEELAGLHSYCRNPGGKEHQPWCYVKRDGQPIKAICDIPKCAHKIWIYIIGTFVVLIIIFGSITVYLCVKRNKENNSNIRSINLPNADKNIYGNSRVNSPLETIDLLSCQNGNENEPNSSRRNGILRVPNYSLSQIKFLEELGEGAFGKVYKGALVKGSETLYVAVKALKENASVKTKNDFRREIELISELRHENIVCIVGVALQEEPLCMLFEFMARGDLHEFLMGRAPPAGKGLPSQRLLSIARHIACGMQYLASHHYVHRDLAARNCLVSDDFVVKISDFGLSRDIYSSDYYRVQSKSLLPVRWMPPESILYGKFTTDSDIWSYGVVLWEIYSYGLQPYYGYSNQEVIGMVRGGDLLSCPAECPPAVYALMKECWRHSPQKRPSFEVIAVRLQTWEQTGICTEIPSSEVGSSSTLNRQTIALGDIRERLPLIPAHGTTSNGSLRTSSLRKPSKIPEDTRSTCSEIPPHRKKGSCGSLDTDRMTRETVVRMRTSSQGNDI